MSPSLSLSIDDTLIPVLPVLTRWLLTGHNYVAARDIRRLRRCSRQPGRERRRRRWSSTSDACLVDAARDSSVKRSLRSTGRTRCEPSSSGSVTWCVGSGPTASRPCSCTVGTCTHGFLRHTASATSTTPSSLLL